uniref:Uncharacterized protein n=1 Tax=Glossina austeni TaxID=7395 RepID=A0A1A9VWS5_GLOAU
MTYDPFFAMQHSSFPLNVNPVDDILGENSLAWSAFEDFQVDGLSALWNAIAKMLLCEILPMSVNNDISMETNIRRERYF